MSQQTYPIKCECGNEHHVLSADAGSRIDCPCGKVMVVPKLSALRVRTPTTHLDEVDRRAGLSRAVTWMRIANATGWVVGLGLFLPLVIGLRIQPCLFGLEVWWGDSARVSIVPFWSAQEAVIGVGLILCLLGAAVCGLIGRLAWFAIRWVFVLFDRSTAEA